MAEGADNRCPSKREGENAVIGRDRNPGGNVRDLKVSVTGAGLKSSARSAWHEPGMRTPSYMGACCPRGRDRQSKLLGQIKLPQVAAQGCRVINPNRVWFGYGGSDTAPIYLFQLPSPITVFLFFMYN